MLGRLGVLLVGGVLCALPLRGQSPLDAAARQAVVDDLITKLHAEYVFPDRAASMETALRAHVAAGAYDGITDRNAFAQRLTEDVQAVTHDRHLRVRAQPFSPPVRDGETRARPDPAAAIGRVEILEGNIGVVEIRSFGFPRGVVREIVRETMTRVADASALIVDVRANGGGDPGFVALVSSYLFDDEPVHLNSLYFRPADQTTDFFTDPGVEGRRFGGSRPVYVLTSDRTFSAAEEFTYNLQALGRATIVGDTTGGGAHPGGVRPLPHDMSVFVPSGRAINPITKTNWEGTGVVPDVPVAAQEALDEALRLARAARGVSFRAPANPPAGRPAPTPDPAESRGAPVR